MRIESTLRIGRNPQYFSDDSGRAIFLTGSHTWNNLADIGPKGALVPFDWGDYLDFLEHHGHNFIRLWAYPSLGTWNPADEVQTTPWVRTGPGNAIDGRPKLDLNRLDDAYFNRMRERVESACKRGIYVSVMFFEGNCLHPFTTIPGEYHMFVGANNINGIDISTKMSHGAMVAGCTLQDPAVLDIQKAYIRRIVETVGDLDNVLYEICNEAGPQSHEWQEYLTKYVRGLESGRGKQHPIGQTGGIRTHNRLMHGSSADWVSPDANSADGLAQGYKKGHYTYGRGPFEKGDRPIMLDTDHLWGIGGDAAWAWKSFCRGYNLLYMDRWNDKPSGFYYHERWPLLADEGLRRELGAIRRIAERLDLLEAHPLNDAASSGYCIGVAGRQYLAFAPDEASICMDLPAGEWQVTWRDTGTGKDSESRPFLMPTSGTVELTGAHKGPGAIFVESAGS